MLLVPSVSRRLHSLRAWISRTSCPKKLLLASLPERDYGEPYPQYHYTMDHSTDKWHALGTLVDYPFKLVPF